MTRLRRSVPPSADPEIQPRPWDSAFFGLRIGQLRPDPDEGTDLRAIEELDRSEFDCVFVELSLSAANVLHRWHELGARVVDVRLELEAQLGGAMPFRSDPAIRRVTRWTTPDREAMVDLAEDQAAWSRFARDPAFAGSIRRMYRNWIGMAFDGELETLVWREDGRITGMLASKADERTASIELFDVSEAYRGRGIGLALIHRFMAEALASGRHSVRVRTQVRNVAAVRTYERAGFVSARATFVLHWWSRANEPRTSLGES